VRTRLGDRRVVTQEPGFIELNDGRVRMWTRTTRNCQWCVDSPDGGVTWGEARPWTLASPCSPATVVRLSDGRLFAVWNDHTGWPTRTDASGWSVTDQSRTPLTAAFSANEGVIWTDRVVLEDAPDGFFCYTAVLERPDGLLLGYCVKTARNLATLRLARLE